MIYNYSSLLVAEKNLERLLSQKAFHQGEPDMELIEDKATVVGELQLAARAEEFMVHVRMGLRKSGLYIHSIRFKEMNVFRREWCVSSFPQQHRLTWRSLATRVVQAAAAWCKAGKRRGWGVVDVSRQTLNYSISQYPSLVSQCLFHCIIAIPFLPALWRLVAWRTCSLLSWMISQSSLALGIFFRNRNGKFWPRFWDPILW